ncbi:MAG: hypothetical protein JXN61_05510 [Sedimentisphaerales bacterium]|nr:hypothetical protein [Sedimentisphaerales bacterium]
MVLVAAFCAVSVAIDGIFMLLDPGLYRRCFAYLGEWFGGAWLPVYGLTFCMMGSVLGLSLRCIGAPAVYCTAGVVLVVCGLCLMFLRAERLDFIAVWWAARPSWLYRIGGVIFILLGAMVLQGLATL